MCATIKKLQDVGGVYWAVDWSLTDRTPVCVCVFVCGCLCACVCVYIYM